MQLEIYFIPAIPARSAQQARSSSSSPTTVRGFPATSCRTSSSYWQAAETATQGAGLGLFIAKGIVEAHGVDIHVDGIPGTGSIFSFTIPT
jgi:light-regulated signal transduction histidine kinase (bacteriophytochrome)